MAHPLLFGLRVLGDQLLGAACLFPPTCGQRRVPSGKPNRSGRLRFPLEGPPFVTESDVEGLGLLFPLECPEDSHFKSSDELVLLSKADVTPTLPLGTEAGPLPTTGFELE